MKYLIDGYNVIFECGLHTRHVNVESLARARQRLLRELVANLPQSEHPAMTVVFDAVKIPLSSQKEQELFGKIEIRYSIHHEDADSLIEELIAKHATPKKLTVISSDHRIQKAAIRRKAVFSDSGPWYDKLVMGELRNQIKRETRSTESVESAESNKSPLLSDIEIEALSIEAEKIVDADINPPDSAESSGFGSARNRKNNDDKNNVNDSFDPFPPDYLDDFDEIGEA